VTTDVLRAKGRLDAVLLLVAVDFFVGVVVVLEVGEGLAAFDFGFAVLTRGNSSAAIR
jgi:hypothetical protein